MTRVACLPGDGVGPEVTSAARTVLDAAGFRAEWSEHPVGWSEWRAHGEALPAATLEACRAADVILFGAITSKPEDAAQRELAPHLRGTARYRSPILRLRQELDLFANLRPVRGPGVDLVVVRENTEGLYAGLEAHPVPQALAQLFPGAPTGADAAVSLRVITRRATERVCEAAFRLAEREGRRTVTLAEKPNVLRQTGGLVRTVFHEIAARHPGIRAEEENIDAACARLVRDAGSFDVLVATNLFGDILSDVAAEAGGGLPLAASANLGERHALFEPVHGSAPGIAGQGVANPLGAVRSAALLARHVGQPAVAGRVEAAVATLLAEGKHLPRDMGGRASTADVTGRLVTLLEQ